MGKFLDWLKNLTSTTDSKKNFSMSTEEYNRMRQNEINRLEKAYDFYSIEGIRAIPVPCRQVNPTGSVTGAVEYYLRTRAVYFWQKGQHDLAIECLKKSNQLLPHSHFAWGQDDYERLVRYLKNDGRWEEAEAEEKKIRKLLGIEELEKHISAMDGRDIEVEALKKSAKRWKNDLVEAGDIRSCCAKCAMYRRRVYSLFGKDKRFPKLPDDFHTDCGISLFHFTYGLDHTSFPCKNVISYSNRPFIDDRDAKELDDRKEKLKMYAKSAETEIAREVYYKLKRILPDDVPKSLSAFSRMKNANSPKYQALVEKAKSKGFIFPEMKVDVDYTDL